MTLTDSAGGKAARDVTVTVIGTNEQPQLAFGSVSDNTFVHTASVVSGDFGENAGVTGDAAAVDAHKVNGTFTFTDFNAASVDTFDTHTVSTALAVSEWRDAHGNSLGFEDPHNAALLSSVALFGEVANPLLSDPTFAQQISAATFSAWRAQDSTNGGNGVVGWNFDLPDNSVDFLAAGETLTLSYNVTVTDSHLASSTQTVTVTVTGTNDAPVITAATQSGAVTEDIGMVAGNLSTTGTITFQDVDLDDTHCASFVLTSSDAAANLPGFAEGTSAAAAQIGTFALTAITEGQHQCQALGWTFTLDDNDPVLQSLAQGETITQVYTVTLTDNNNAAVTQDVTVTITRDQ